MLARSARRTASKWYPYLAAQIAFAHDLRATCPYSCLGVSSTSSLDDWDLSSSRNAGSMLVQSMLVELPLALSSELWFPVT